MKRLIFVAFAGPVAWTLHSLLSVTLVPAACTAPPGPFLLHGVTVILALLAISGTVTALRLAPATPGQRFVSTTSLLINSFFTLVIVAEGIPNAVLNPCWS